MQNNRATSLDAMQRELQELQKNKDRWATTEIDERIVILDQIKRDLIPVSQRWVTLCMEAKGIFSYTHGEGEEWGTLSDIYNLLGSLRQSLVGIKKCGLPQIAGPISILPNGQVSARVFPRTKIEAMLYAGLSLEVRMESGVSSSQVPQSQAKALLNANGRGSVNLVLGAGNASSLPVNDSLYKLFVENHVVILKLNPINAYLGPLI